VSQGTILVGALLAMFAVFLLVNNRVPTYLSVIGL
jgi:hypothetical protein